MAERSEDRRNLNGVTHPSRREVIRVLGGSALLGPFFVAGCFSRDPLSPDDHTGSQLLLDAQAVQEDLPPPLILFVPGFTGAGELDDKFGTGGDLIDRYYSTQKAYLDGLEDPRPWVDMNAVPLDADSDPKGPLKLYEGTDNEVTLNFNKSGAGLFDSGRRAITCNADAIAAFLGVCQRGGVRVTVVSHSKGGQDVLHALITNRGLWYPFEAPKVCPPTVAGWVAFTSNFFESEFPITGTGPAGNRTDGCDSKKTLPESCTANAARNGRCGTVPPTCSPTAESLYSDFPAADEIHFLRDQPFEPKKNAARERKRRRITYMRRNKREIKRLVKWVPTLSLYGTYVPEYNINGEFSDVYFLDKFNWAIRKEAQDADDPKPGGASDGLVPARAGQLPTATIERLPEDGDSQRCGVDHMAVAVEMDNPAEQSWTSGFRNQKTLEYIEQVEAGTTPECEGEPPPEPPPEEPSSAERIEQLIGAVEELRRDGSLSAGEANSLTSKCDGAMAALDKGNTGAATNELGAFINQVNAMVNSGRLEAEEGQELIDAAQAAIDAINDGR